MSRKTPQQIVKAAQKAVARADASLAAADEAVKALLTEEQEAEQARQKLQMALYHAIDKEERFRLEEAEAARQKVEQERRRKIKATKNAKAGKSKPVDPKLAEAYAMADRIRGRSPRIAMSELWNRLERAKMEGKLADGAEIPSERSLYRRYHGQ